MPIGYLLLCKVHIQIHTLANVRKQRLQIHMSFDFLTLADVRKTQLSNLLQIGELRDL